MKNNAVADYECMSLSSVFVSVNFSIYRIVRQQSEGSYQKTQM